VEDSQNAETETIYEPNLTKILLQKQINSIFFIIVCCIFIPTPFFMISPNSIFTIIFLLIFFSPIIFFLYFVYVYIKDKNVQFGKIVIDNIGVHFQKETLKPVPWSSISSCEAGHDTPDIFFAIRPEFMTQFTSNRYDSDWNANSLWFEPSLFERKGPSLADQIRRHAPHLRPPGENI
jgi:hypothetical protein